VGGNVPVDSATFLMTDFMNLKIKPIQSFKDTHRSRMCAYMFIGVNAHMCMSICVYTVFLKKLKLACENNNNNIKTEGV
jgi:hypothetical protein